MKTGHNLILDLDETLVHSMEDMDSLKPLNIFTDPKLVNVRNRIYHIQIEDVTGKKGTGESMDLWGITRPHLKEFKEFADQYFKHVIFWSAGKKRYVDAIVDMITHSECKSKAGGPMIYSYNDCKFDSNNPGGLSKPINKMAQKEHDLKLTLANTFIVDDRETVFIHDNPDNGIIIPPYNPPLTIEGIMADDPTLLQLKYWFMLPLVRSIKDIRLLDKSEIFTTPLSTYRKILDISN